MSFIPEPISYPITLQSLFGKKRMIGSFTVQTIVSEDTDDSLTITKHPVQSGASITDHAFKEPTVLSMRILAQNNNPISGITATFSGGGLNQIYQQLLDLQSLRNPIAVVTPKRTYPTMLISSIKLTTDKSSENILSLVISLQEIILVSIGTTQVPPERQRKPKKTQATQQSGRKSAALSTSQAAGSTFQGFSKAGTI